MHPVSSFTFTIRTFTGFNLHCVKLFMRSLKRLKKVRDVNITFFKAQIENEEQNDENEVEVNRLQPVICSSASEVDNTKLVSCS